MSSQQKIEKHVISGNMEHMTDISHASCTVVTLEPSFNMLLAKLYLAMEELL